MPACALLFQPSAPSKSFWALVFHLASSVHLSFPLRCFACSFCGKQLTSINPAPMCVWLVTDLTTVQNRVLISLLIYILGKFYYMWAIKIWLKMTYWKVLLCLTQTKKKGEIRYNLRCQSFSFFALNCQNYCWIIFRQSFNWAINLSPQFEDFSLYESLLSVHLVTELNRLPFPKKLMCLSQTAKLPSTVTLSICPLSLHVPFEVRSHTTATHCGA